MRWRAEGEKGSSRGLRSGAYCSTRQITPCWPAPERGRLGGHGLTPWHRADSGRIYSDHGPNLRWRNPFGSGDHRRSGKAALGGRGTARGSRRARFRCRARRMGRRSTGHQIKARGSSATQDEARRRSRVDEIVAGQCVCGRIAGLNPAVTGAIFVGCSTSDQLSWLGKIPDLAGGSIFYGPMAKRKRSRVSSPSMTRSSGLLSTLRLGRGTRTSSPAVDHNV
jgi:hypothetical protein